MQNSKCLAPAVSETSQFKNFFPILLYIYRFIEEKKNNLKRNKKIIHFHLAQQTNIIPTIFDKVNHTMHTTTLQIKIFSQFLLRRIKSNSFKRKKDREMCTVISCLQINS